MIGGPDPAEPSVQIGDPPGVAPGGPASTEAPLGLDEIRKRAIGGALAIAGRGIVLRIIGFFGGLVLARLLVPDQYGLIALAQSVVAITAVISGGGFGAALIGREAEPEQEELAAVFGLQLLLSMGLMVVAIVAGVFLGTVGLLIAIMSLALPIDALRVVPAVLLERRLRYGLLVQAEIIDLVAYNILAIALVVAGLGVEGVAIAGVGRAIAGTVVLLRYGPRAFTRPSLRLAPVRGILAFGVAFQSVGFLVVVRDWLLNVGIAVVAGNAAVGFWALTSRLLSVVGLVLESLWRVTYPAVARLLDAGEKPEAMLERGLNFVALATGAFAVALAGSAPVLIPVLLGDRWEPTIAIVPWAAVALFLSGPLSTVAGGYLFAVGAANQVLRTVLVQAVVWLIAALTLLPVIGPPAIGVGLLISAVADVVYLRIVVHRHIDLPIARPILWPLVALVAAIIAAQAVGRALTPDVWALIAVLIVGGAVYLGVLLVRQRAAVIGIVDLLREFIGRARHPAAQA
ncbi:MAG: oligosaccharide flippase family protein [Solirubrobacteraceae bacterium]